MLLDYLLKGVFLVSFLYFCSGRDLIGFFQQIKINSEQNELKIKLCGPKRHAIIAMCRIPWIENKLFSMKLHRRKQKNGVAQQHQKCQLNDVG